MALVAGAYGAYQQQVLWGHCPTEWLHACRDGGKALMAAPEAVKRFHCSPAAAGALSASSVASPGCRKSASKARCTCCCLRLSSSCLQASTGRSDRAGHCLAAASAATTCSGWGCWAWALQLTVLLLMFAFSCASDKPILLCHGTRLRQGPGLLAVRDVQ